MKLYEIDEALRTLLESMEDYIDEETGLIDPSFHDKLSELDQEARLKIEGCGVIGKELQIEAKALKAEYDRLHARAKAAERRRVWLFDYVTDMIKSMGIDKHKSPNNLFTVYLQKNPDSLHVDYPDNLPAQYQRIKPVEPIIDDLKKDIAEGKVSDAVIKKAGIITVTGQQKVRFK